VSTEATRCTKFTIQTVVNLCLAYGPPKSYYEMMPSVRLSVRHESLGYVHPERKVIETSYLVSDTSVFGQQRQKSRLNTKQAIFESATHYYRQAEMLTTGFDSVPLGFFQAHLYSKTALVFPKARGYCQVTIRT